MTITTATATITGKVTGLTRLRNGRDGNPRWEVLITPDDGGRAFRTLLVNDEVLAYCIDNEEFATTAHTFGLRRDGTMDGRVG
jgi:hypothetical protein